MQKYRMFQALVASCLDRAALSPEAIEYMALHGTGTPLGDPIEVGALSAALQSHGIDTSAHVVAFGSNKACLLSSEKEHPHIESIE